MRILALSLTLLAVMPALAQDLLSVAPGAKVEYEDARVRVVRLRIAPHETLPMHDRPRRVVISLTPNDVRSTRPDGTTSNVRTVAGRVDWSESARRSIQNLETPVENIIVEMKQANSPAKALPSPPEPRPSGYLEDKFHRWLFENQYVRVYDTRIPPGETTEFHTHAYDYVFVQISEGLTAEQPQGQPWSKAEKSEAGAVGFRADSKKTRIHRVRNVGTAEYHVIVVQLMP